MHFDELIFRLQTFQNSKILGNMHLHIHQLSTNSTSLHGTVNCTFYFTTFSREKFALTHIKNINVIFIRYSETLIQNVIQLSVIQDFAPIIYSFSHYVCVQVRIFKILVANPASF